MKFKLANSLTERIILSMNERNNYVARISRVVNATNSGISRIIKGLVESKLIFKKRDGVTIYLYFTERGKQVQELLKKLREYN